MFETNIPDNYTNIHNERKEHCENIGDMKPYLEALSRKSPLNIICNPNHLFLITILSIFMAEMIIMILLTNLPQISAFNTALFDSVLLIGTILPIMYFLLFKPFRDQLARLKQEKKQRERLVLQLNYAIDKVNTVKGLSPICISCNKIRDQYVCWSKSEDHIHKNSYTQHSHSICPECIDSLKADSLEYRISHTN